MFLSAFLLAFHLAAQAVSAEAADRTTLVFENATVIDGTGAEPMPRRTVVVRGGRIDALFETGSRPLPPGARVVDLTGHTILPGLIDGHVHFEGAEDREARLRALLRSGVTMVRELAGDARITADLQRRQAAGEIEGPAIRFAAVFYARLSSRMSAPAPPPPAWSRGRPPGRGW